MTQKDIDGKVEDFKIILVRSGLVDNRKNRQILICSNHLQDMGVNFCKKVLHSDRCINPASNSEIGRVGLDHKSDWQRARLPANKRRTITYELSSELLRKTTPSYSLPYGATICGNCRRMVLEAIKHLPEPEAMEEDEEQEDTDEEDEMDGEDTESEDANDFDFSSADCDEDEDYQPGGQDSDDGDVMDMDGDVVSREKKVESLNGFLSLSEEGSLLNDNLLMDYDLTDVSRKNKLKNVLAATNVAALKLISEDKANQSKLFEDMVHSRKVENKISGPVRIPDDVSIIMESYAKTTNRLERRRILSFLIPKYKYAFLKKFNKSKEGAKFREGENVSDNEDDNDEEPPEVVDGGKELPTWSPALTRHEYRKAKLHYIRFGFAFAPIFKKSRFVHKLDIEVLHAISDFITSYKITQSTATGSINVTNSKGEKIPIARVLRNFHNEELARQIASYLADKGFSSSQIPSRSTILNILSRMPAGRTKYLGAINQAIDDAKRGFEALVRVINNIKPVASQIFGSEKLDNLLDALFIAQRYYKTHFQFHLSKDSSTASHCINHGKSFKSTIIT